MDSSYFLLSNNNIDLSLTSSNITNDLEQSSSFSSSTSLSSSSSSSSTSSSFNYDPYDGFSFLDQPINTKLYDYLGVAGLNNNSNNNNYSTSSFSLNQTSSSPSSSSPLDQFDQACHFANNHRLNIIGGGASGGGISGCGSSDNNLINNNNFPFQTNPTSKDEEDDDDLSRTLADFVDCNDVDFCADGGDPSVDCLFSTSNIIDYSDPSSETYQLRLTLEHNNYINGCDYMGSNIVINSDMNNCNNLNNFDSYNCNIYNNNNFNGNVNDSNNNISNNNISDSNLTTIRQQQKRSVLMNLLIDGSDVGAGYTSHNCRALPRANGIM